MFESTTMQRSAIRLALILSGLGGCAGVAQEAWLREADEVSFPTSTDGNSPSFWWDDRLYLFTSVGWPLKLSVADSQFDEWETYRVEAKDFRGKAVWVEAAWVDNDGTVFGWYHHEPGGMYEGSYLTAPKIGALVSFDGGASVHDLGIILESGDAPDPDAQNGFFTGGHGDVSVVLDRGRKYFYFFFTNYGGPEATQGVAVARMAFADRFKPAGRVYKYYSGDWREPGVGGRITPVFRAVRGWRHKDPDSFWGPSLHWNTYLRCYVMLLNHASGEPGWSQEGIYVSYAADLSVPAAWSAPSKILDSLEIPNWSTFYPQVMGLEAGGTDTHAGKVARFYLNGTSTREIEFFRAVEKPTPNPYDSPGEPKKDGSN